MPVEVIDLLSSPQIPLPRPRAKTKTNTPAAAPAPSWPSQPPAAALDYDDVPDLTDISRDGYISIPRTTARPAPNKTSSLPGPRIPSRAAHDFFSSDDDAATFDVLNDRSDALPPRKRLRISPVPSGGNTTGRTIVKSASEVIRPPVAATATAAAAASLGVGRGAPVVLQPAALKKWNSSADPIRTSSDNDPFASSPKRIRKEIFIDLSLDDDPLASSPRPVTRADTGKEPLDCNPFASSPRSTTVRDQLPSSPLLVGIQPQGKGVSGPPRNQPVVKGKGKAVEWDHISSSAPSAGHRDNDWDMDIQPPRKMFSRSRSVGVDFDLGDLADYDVGSEDEEDLPEISGLKPSHSSSSRSKSALKTARKAGSSSRVSASKASAVEKELERLDKAAARETEKRRKQREKDEAKEQRQREKARAAALAEVNKVRTDKKVSTPEMIVDLPTSLAPSLKLQAETLLEDLSVKSHSYPSPVNNVIKWRRKVRAVFNEAEGHWEPIPERIENDNHAMVIIKAPEFVELALGAEGSDLEAHVLRMQRHYKDHTLIYLIEGFNTWMRGNRTKRNRDFQSAVRSAGLDAADISAPPPSAQQSSRRGRKKDTPTTPYVDEDALEDALLQLQVHHGALIHHTDVPVQTAQWIAVFTQHISTIPYRRQRDAANAGAAFCMDSGQVRTGEDARDTYVRMLQEVARVTAPIAYGIAAEFGSAAALVRGLEREGPLALEAIRKSANRDGAYTDRTVGQAMSRRVWKVFTGTDETSTDI